MRTAVELLAPELPVVGMLDVALLRDALQELLAESPERLPISREQKFGGLRCAAQLQNAQLLDAGGRPRFRVNRIGERTFLTDLPELTRDGGVFPYEDEAERLLCYLNESGTRADALVDVGMGCGHVLLSIDAGKRIGVDVSPRAGAFMRLNAELNQMDARWMQGDAAQALAVLAGAARPLVVGNLPHAPVPADLTLAGFADGGRTGSSVIEATLETLARSYTENMEIVLLCYSLAASGRGESLVPRLAERLFGGDRVRWIGLVGSPMWRIAGTMSAISPMSLAEWLPRKADCPYYVGTHEQERVRVRYQALAAELQAEGWDRLAYGVLHVTVP